MIYLFIYFKKMNCFDSITFKFLNFQFILSFHQDILIIIKLILRINNKIIH